MTWVIIISTFKMISIKWNTYYDTEISRNDAIIKWIRRGDIEEIH